MQEPSPGAPRSLSPLGIAAFVLFLAAGLAFGLWLRDHSSPQGGERVSARQAASKPNVVVMMTDDQTLEQLRAMPQTRNLIGGAGIGFERFYVTDPLCCPSRTTFLTGQYAHNHGVISNGGPNGLPALDEEDTLAPWLQRAGYRTAFVGKYLNGYGEQDPRRVPPGWSEWHALLEPTAQSYFDYDLNEDGEIRHYGDEPHDYKTRVLGHLATDAVRRADRAGRPLFLYLAFNAPHAPSTPAPRDADTFAGIEPRRPSSFNEADMADKPQFLRERPALDERALARIDDRRERALETLAEVDRQIARLVGVLDRQDELDDTYIFFTSDNGYLDGEHRVEFGKLLPYEPSSRVPLLIRGPAIPADARSPALAGNVDLAPTILDLARADATVKLDGRSLLPYATDPDRDDPSRALLIESLVRDRSTYYGFPYEAIRAGRWLYVRYATGDEELYDLVADPGELVSRHADRDYAEVRAELAKALDRLADCTGEECQRPVGPLAPPR